MIQSIRIKPLLTLLLGSLLANAAAAQAGTTPTGLIVVANRDAGNISVIKVVSDRVLGTVRLPGNVPSEPMYVVHIKDAGLVYVGDRANDRVVAFNDQTFQVVNTLPTGDGVFHMWADNQGKQLWVNNDVDKTMTVIDAVNQTVLTTVPVPADLVANGGKPHDVVVEPFGNAAYITVTGINGPNDVVVQFDTRTFKELRRVDVGKDPHLTFSFRTGQLYVPAQNSNGVKVLDGLTLQSLGDISIPGAHGASNGYRGRAAYFTDLPGGGAKGLYAVDTSNNSVFGCVDTPFDTPHNIATSGDGRKIYVTHSGSTADQVSVYTSSAAQPIPVHIGNVTTDLNPFGLAFIDVEAP